MQAQLKKELAKEAEELNEKIHNLELFLQLNDETLMGEPLELLEIQFELMCAYHDILMERISKIDPR